MRFNEGFRALWVQVPVLAQNLARDESHGPQGSLCETVGNMSQDWGPSHGLYYFGWGLLLEDEDEPIGVGSLLHAKDYLQVKDGTHLQVGSRLRGCGWALTVSARESFWKPGDLA